MIAVIQCAATKRSDAGFLETRRGEKVLFCADPASAPERPGYVYARPDDLSDRSKSWRQILLDYNADPGNNPLGLLEAYQLYENPTYRKIVNQLGVEKTYILSAGWGLIEAGFLTPYYDITFSQAARKVPYKRRTTNQKFEDFRMLSLTTEEPVLFFGGKDYVPLFCQLTQGVKAKRVIFHSSSFPPTAPGCVLEKFSTSTRTNWHYECAAAFLNGKVHVTPLPAGR